MEIDSVTLENECRARVHAYCYSCIIIAISRGQEAWLQLVSLLDGGASLRPVCWLDASDRCSSGRGKLSGANEEVRLGECAYIVRGG
jgi:hypothetical protein